MEFVLVLPVYMAAIGGILWFEVLESCVPVTRLTLAIRVCFVIYFVQLRIAKVNRETR